MNHTDSTRRVLVAICDALQNVEAYSTETGKVEVERLYSIATDFSAFVGALRSAGAFAVGPALQQRDIFFDLRRDGRWILAATDHYVRLREERADDGTFLRGEVKKGYPGPDGNPNARPAKDCKLTEKEVPTWREILRALGLEPEREYVKRRIGCTSNAKFDGMTIDLEIDHFANESCNGPLRGQAFVSTSIEAPGTDQPRAETALASLLPVLRSMGVPLVICTGCYEDYFYGKMRLPEIERSSSAYPCPPGSSR
ncbi:MAG: hypothetical protein ACLQVD_19425 [Capsulimonadaceae bacterium]